MGEGAPLSASALQRLKEKWQGEYNQWKSVPIKETNWAYLWADGIYVKAGHGKEREALLVVIGVQKDGQKRFLALESGYRESKESWGEVLRQLKSRGVKSARLLLAMETSDCVLRLGRFIPRPVAALLESQNAQRDRRREQERAESSKEPFDDHDVYNCQQKALKERKIFEQTFRHNPKAVKTVVENWEKLTAYFDFPRKHWQHLRASNVVKSPFSRVRLRTTDSRRFKSQVNATCLIWKTMMVAEMSFRKLNAPLLVDKVARGTKCENGEHVRDTA